MKKAQSTWQITTHTKKTQINFKLTGKLRKNTTRIDCSMLTNFSSLLTHLFAYAGKLVEKTCAVCDEMVEES